MFFSMNRVRALLTNGEAVTKQPARLIFTEYDNRIMLINNNT